LTWCSCTPSLPKPTRPTRLAHTGAWRIPNVVGHLDWRVQNLAFTDNRVSAIYDWDSVALVPEPALVGSASVIPPIDWRLERPDPLPTLAQLDGFVADYEAARGAPFSVHDHEVLTPGQRWIASYGARCQHSDDLLGIFPRRRSVARVATNPPRVPGSVRPGSRTVALRRPQPGVRGYLVASPGRAFRARLIGLLTRVVVTTTPPGANAHDSGLTSALASGCLCSSRRRLTSARRRSQPS